MILTITDRERELQAANAELLAEVARLTPLQYHQSPCRNQCEAQAFRIDERNLTTALQAMTQNRNELRAELAALKQQPHIARATGKNSGDYSEVARVYETPLPAGVALYLAPGAQPVPKGMQLVPIEPNVNMYIAGAKALIQHALLLKSVGRSTDMIHTSDEALSRKMFKAMLGAAKPCTAPRQ